MILAIVTNTDVVEATKEACQTVMVDLNLPAAAIPQNVIRKVYMEMRLDWDERIFTDWGKPPTFIPIPYW